MARLTKVWAASFFERQHKGRPFATNKVVAVNMDQAQELAEEWGEAKWGARLVEVRIERSKGEVIAHS